MLRFTSVVNGATNIAAGKCLVIVLPLNAPPLKISTGMRYLFADISMPQHYYITFRSEIPLHDAAQ